MELIDVVRKLVGPIQPIGETQADERRFNNLQDMTDLINTLLRDVDDVAGEKASHEFSVRRAGEYASKFFDELGIQK